MPAHSTGRQTGRVHRWARVAGLALAGALLAGCGVGASAAAPHWSPQPQFTVEGGPQPQLPDPNGPQNPGSPGPGSGSTPGSGAPTTPGVDPAVVATHLLAPTGLVLLPDGSALVGERTTGRILRVQPQGGQPVTTVRTLTGLSTSGDGGLLDLALSPTYGEDGLIYAYVTTPTDNRVIHFTMTGPSTPVITGIPRGATDNAGRIAFDPAGNLYVGTGDAGIPAHAADRASLAGKILRVNAIGQPAAGNPGASPVYARGLRTVDGLCVDPDTGTVFAGQAGSPTTPDEVDIIRSGADYGWPPGRPDATAPAATLPADEGDVGGCAVLGSRLYLTSRTGTSLQVAPFGSAAPGSTPAVAAFSTVFDKRYGRLLTVVAAPDGALWLTTSNRDGHGKPIPADDRVIRILPAAGGGGSPPV